MNTVRHLQLVILGIMKDIDELCKKNDITYYLLCGSALGAVRHKGFIPWDDDLDIVMDYNNYDKFVSVCKTQLDTKKYYFQEGLVDWPMPFSKVRLKGTFLEEPGAYGTDKDKRGIFVDIFKLDNAAPTLLGRKWQYLCGKYTICYSLLKRGYKEASLKKKLLMWSSVPLNLGFLRRFFYHQLTKYNGHDATYTAIWGLRYRFHATFFRKEIFKGAKYVPFEDIELPIPVGYDEMLTQVFGDYMTPPPVKDRQGLHLLKVDFGKY